MAIALKQRRLAMLANETTRGTFFAGISAANDALPTIRAASFEITPISIARKTLRLSLTPFADTYPGVATCKINFTCELGGLPLNPKADYDVPNWGDALRGCGFQEISNANGGAKPRLLQNVTSLSGGTAGSPLRHGETVTGVFGTPTTSGSGTVIGDFYAEDDVLCVQEAPAPVGSGALTWTNSGGSGRAAVGTRNTQSIVAYQLTSNVNVSTPLTAGATGQVTCSIELDLDGKRVQAKGCMGDVQLLMEHGDMIRGAFTFQGVVVNYGDFTMPTTANELHKVAPTFLGREVRFYESTASPKGYGRDAAGFANVSGSPTVEGSANKITISTGNQVVLRQNSFDQNGVSNALITGRSPEGSFNPDEVLSSEFDWVTKFLNGTPFRFKAMLGSPGTVTSQDGNSIDIIAPGIVTSKMGDSDRDGINVWDLGFKLSGGDYDPSAAGENVGNDNELTILYR